MQVRLTIRTGLWLVLLLFCLALWASAGLAWMGARQSAHAIDALARLSERQIQPLHDTERLLQSALVNMNNAYINLQRADQIAANDYTRKASAAIQLARKVFDGYRAAADPGDERAMQVMRAYDRYAHVLGTREVALYDVSLDAYAAATGDTDRADAEFGATLREVTAWTQAQREALREMADRRAALAGSMALGLAGLSVALAAVALMFFRRRLLGPLERAGQYSGRIAAGDLSCAAPAWRDDEIGTLLTALGSMREGLVGMVGTIRGGTHEVDNGASGIADGNLALSSRTEQQAAALEQTSATMEQLSSAVRQNADHTRRTLALARAAADGAAKGGESVATIARTMEQVSSSAGQIAEIVGLIDGIAFQTNILALNAAVEAARAGAQGKGFAVVADEVRALALRSAKAAAEVKELIGGSSANVALAAAQATDADRTMGAIVASAGQLMQTLEDIAAATGEQSDGIEQVSRAVVEMDRATQQNAALVEQTAAAATALKAQSDRLVQAVSVFRLEAGPDRDEHRVDAADRSPGPADAGAVALA